MGRPCFPSPGGTPTHPLHLLQGPPRLQGSPEAHRPGILSAQRGGLGGGAGAAQGPPVPSSRVSASFPGKLVEGRRAVSRGRGAEDEKAPPHSDHSWGGWNLGADEEQGRSGLVISGLNTSV